MKIDFIDFINGYDNSGDKDLYLKKHIVETYVNFEKKLDACRAIVNATMQKEDNLWRDDNLKGFLLDLEIIKSYTDVDIENINKLEMYNEFEKRDINSKIQNSDSLVKEVERFNKILTKMSDDFIENEYSFRSIANKLATIFEVLAKDGDEENVKMV